MPNENACPRCGGTMNCLAGRSAHPSNWYCENPECGYQAWDHPVKYPDGAAVKPWGYYKVLKSGPGYWVKELFIEPGKRLSLQSHEERDEVWVCLSGEGLALLQNFPKTLARGATMPLRQGNQILVPRGWKHRIINNSRHPLIVLETATGNPVESDIVRYEDDYGREVEEH